MRQEPEEIAAKIVWGVQEQFVSETTNLLIERLTSLDFVDYRTEYLVERMARENAELLNQIYLKYKDRIAKDVKETLEPYLLDLDTEKAIQGFTGHSIASVPYSESVKRLTESTIAGCTEIIARQNIALIGSQADTWYQVASTAVTRANATMMSETQIIADAVKELAANQIFTVDYKSGVRNKVDVAIRRHVVTQINQNYQRMNDLRTAEYGLDLFMCSAHPASRPEHFPLQGEIFSKGQNIGQRIDGHTVRDYDEMNIGSVTGIYGANCSHYTTPYIPGFSKLQESPYSEEENEKRYNLTQTQRRYERDIRATKTEIYDLQKAGLDDTKERLKLGQQQTRVRNFCDTNKLTRQPNRERAYGIGEQPRALRGTKKPEPKPQAPKPKQAASTVENEMRAAARGANPNYSLIERARENLNKVADRANEIVDEFDRGDFSNSGELEEVLKRDRQLRKELKKLKREWGQNCQRCTVAYELRRRGENVVAKKRLARNDTTASQWQHYFENQSYVTVGARTREAAIENLERELLSYGDGSRSIVYVKWSGQRSAHVFNAEVHGGNITYVDPQTGKFDYASWKDAFDSSALRVSRVDDKVLDESLRDKIVGRE